VAAVALADIGICAVGTLLVGMAASSHARELLLPLIFLPLAIPVVIGGVGARVTSHPGKYLGFLVLYDVIFALVALASFEYVALTPAAIVPIGATDRDRLLESPVAARLFVEALAETLRQKQAAVASLSRLHHVDRVREKLLELAREHGRVGRDGIRLDFPLTH